MLWAQFCRVFLCTDSVGRGGAVQSLSVTGLSHSDFPNGITISQVPPLSKSRQKMKHKQAFHRTHQTPNLISSLFPVSLLAVPGTGWFAQRGARLPTGPCV